MLLRHRVAHDARVGVRLLVRGVGEAPGGEVVGVRRVVLARAPGVVPQPPAPLLGVVRERYALRHPRAELDLPLVQLVVRHVQEEPLHVLHSRSVQALCHVTYGVPAAVPGIEVDQCIRVALLQRVGSILDQCHPVVRVGLPTVRG